MIKKKWLYLTVAALCTVAVLAGGCGAEEEVEPPPEDEGWVAPIAGMKQGEENLYIEWQGTSGARHPEKGLDWVPQEKYWDYIAEATGGRLTISSYNYGNTVASTLETPAVVGANIVQFGSSVPTYHPIEIPLGQTMMMPFWGFDNYKVGWYGNCELEAYFSQHPAYIEQCNRVNLQPIPGDGSQNMCIMVRKGMPEVVVPDDLKGLLVRASGYQMQWYDALGGTTVYFSIFDVYEAMQKGMCDVAAFSLNQVYTFQFIEVMGQWINFSPVTGGGLNWCSKEAWDDLPEYMKDIIWSDEAQQIYWDSYITDRTVGEEEGLKMMEERGITKVELTDEQIALWAAPAEVAWDAFVTDVEKLSNGKRIREFLRDAIAYRDSLGYENPWTVYSP